MPHPVGPSGHSPIENEIKVFNIHEIEISIALFISSIH